MISSFLAALQFLTLVPLSADYVRSSGGLRAAFYFPVVGLLIGCVLAGMDWTVGILRFPEPLRSALVVVVLLVLTGGLHVDGLADSADGLFSAKSKEDILRIMKDVHSGPMASAAVASVLLLKFAGVAALSPELRASGILLMPIAGRCALATTMGLFPYARPEGSARYFINGKNRLLAAWGFASALAAGSAFASLPGFAAAAISLAGVALIGVCLERKIGGYTGDTLGAVCEIAECLFLIGIAAFR